MNEAYEPCRALKISFLSVSRFRYHNERLTTGKPILRKRRLKFRLKEPVRHNNCSELIDALNGTVQKMDNKILNAKEREKHSSMPISK